MFSKQNVVNALFWLLVTLILLIAFFFRFYRLADQPLGLFFDPAINGLDTTRLMQRGGHVLFFPTNGGRESLFMYLLIPYIWLFGPTPFALRALTATLSLLTVACLIGFLRHLSLSPTIQHPQTETTPNQKTHSSITNYQLPIINYQSLLPPLAGLTLAVSYWHVAVSRLGQRPIMVPLVAVPLFWFFLKGWVTGQKRWFILSGLFMGLAGYTYPAARLLPLILLLAILPEFLPLTPRPSSSFKQYAIRNPVLSKGSPEQSRRVEGSQYLLIFGLTAALSYTPMAWYLLTHPAQFTARAGSVMVWNFLDTPGQVGAELGRNLLRVTGFFCCRGSPNPIFGLPNYPGSPLILAPFLLIGLFICLKNWRDLFQRLVGVWWLVGIFPSVIAIEAPHPWRMIVAIVPTAILIALGLLHFTAWLQPKLSIISKPSYLQSQSETSLINKIRTTHYALQLIPFLLILLPTPALFRAYFIDWTSLQVTQGIYDYGAIAIRDAVLDQHSNDIPLYLPLDRFNDSTLLFYLSQAFPRQAQLSVTPSKRALVIAPEASQPETTWVRLEKDQAILLPPLTTAGQHLIQAALTGPQTRPIQTLSGETVAHIAPLPNDPARFVQQPTQWLTATFGPVQLTGLTYAPEIAPEAGEWPVTLYWQALSPIRDEYEVILQVVDDTRQSWGDGSGRPTDWVYPTSFWRPGLDHIASQHTITVEHTLSPGRYWLALSVFNPATQTRVPLTGAASDTPDTLFIGPLKVPLPSINLDNEGLRSMNVAFGDVAQLSGVQMDYPGETLTLKLLWTTLNTPNRDYTIFVHVLDEAGNLLVGNDAQPLSGRYPTTIWTSGERILDTHILTLPPDLPPGQYRVAVGLYHQPTDERLPLNLADGRRDLAGRLILSQLLIIGEK